MKGSLKNNKKAFSTIAIVAIVVVIVAVAAAAAYYLMTQNTANPSDSTTPTPAPTSSATDSPSPSAQTSTVADASSLKYSVSLTENGALQGTYTFWGKNAGTDDFSMRIEFNDSEEDTIFIFNGAQKKAWTYSGDEWVDISEYYGMQWDIWNNLWIGYTDSLAAWAGSGDYSYSAEGSTVRIYDISVNPALEDSLFVHT
jgi:hypothetical protein